MTAEQLATLMRALRLQISATLGDVRVATAEAITPKEQRRMRAHMMRTQRQISRIAQLLEMQETRR